MVTMNSSEKAASKACQQGPSRDNSKCIKEEKEKDREKKDNSALPPGVQALMSTIPSPEESPNYLVYKKMEAIIEKMQDENTGVPVKTVKSFMTKIPSVFTGTDLVAWLARHLNLEETWEALHVAHLLAAHGYLFPIDDHCLTVKNDNTYYRFQTPYFWPSNQWEPENTDYAVYLCKRTMQNKARLELADYEAESLARLQKMFSRKWEFIFMQAEAQSKVDKKRDKLERKVLDSQERAFWDVHRPMGLYTCNNMVISYHYMFLEKTLLICGLNVNQIISHLEEDDDVFAADIFITPPDNWQNSDEDSGDEEFASINNLSRHQLLAEAELRVTRSSQPESRIVNELVGDEETVHSIPSTSSVSQPPQPISSLTVTQPPPKRRRVEVTRKWRFVDIPEKSEKEYCEPDFLENLENPVQFFELFFDEEVFELLRSETEKNAIQKGKHAFRITTTDIKHFIAILLLSGYNSVSRYRMYWEQRVDCSFPTVAALMSRNRFEDLLRYFHVADNNNLDPSDKFAKVRPLWKLLNARWVKYYPGDKNLSIDESMIPYYGKHGTKQHIHGKPIRFGYKSWSICTRLGYLIYGELYQGASTGNTHPELGVGASVVLDLISKLPQGSYSFYFDNFFTSLPLLEELQKMGHDGTGTIRANRTEKAPLKDPKEMKKTMASTQCGSEPISKVKRYCDKQKKDVDQPRCFVNYNKFMGGVDRLDQNPGCVNTTEIDPKKLSRINALKAKRLRQCQELILQHNLKNNPIVTITNPQESEEEIQKKNDNNVIKENGETSQPEISVTCVPEVSVKPPTIEQQIEAARRQVSMLRTRLERRNVRVSKVADMFIAYCEQYAEYDAFLTPPEWPNPWVSDTTDMWDQEKQCKEPLPLRRVRRWSFSLRELLQDNAGKEHFAKFLSKEFSGENLKFWLAVQELKALPIRRVAARAKDIWKEYLAADAPSPINIDAASRELTRQKVESGTADRYCFDQAQAHVYHLMKSDSYSRYLRSEMYKDYLNGSKKKTSVKGIRSIVSFTARKETSAN
ncbi:hypothetical protein HW555_010651 [Spodoptera exigua]|uniref:Regulator of G-protein signaling 7 n=1 Tax=Spodoptera exigua TaxID=7107 RepID=A0A835GAV1_SPOEX|nr:hypothetical protein HW555_010651 [Spodoptera exigua]